MMAGGLATASQAKLTWLRFRRHRMAMVGLGIVLLMYLVALFAEPVAPFNPDKSNARLVFHPPQMVQFFDGWAFSPHVLAYRLARDPVTLQPRYVADGSRKVRLRFFVAGDPYKLWGLFDGTIHLIGPENAGDTVFILGADRQGRDVLSRMIHGARASLSIGLVGVSISLVLGITLGGLSGFFGGRVDWGVQRVIEFIISLPTIPIWLALAAILPKEWSPMAIYFTITLIISLVGWTELARVVRGRFLALRGDSFVTAAWLDGCSQGRIIFRHMLPSLTSHIIAAVTLAIPNMILAETALSFLGLGLKPPAISWGALLREAQNVQSIAAAPWLLLPGAAVALTVLALNFLGDGLRDAADPYAH